MMKFLNLLLSNICRTVTTHKILLFVLIVGIAVSSMSFCIYYAQSTSIVNLQDVSNASDRTIDLDLSGVEKKETLYELQNFLKKKNTIDIGFYSIMNSDCKEYDIIGINAETIYYVNPRNGSGFVFDTDSDSDSEIIIPSIVSNIGEVFYEKISGNTYIVKDIYIKENYNSYYFNSKRIPDSLYAVSGVEKNTSDSENQSDEAYGIFMSYNDFVKYGYKPDIFRLRLSTPISEQQKSELINELINEVKTKTGETITVPQTSLVESSNILSQQYNVQALIYITIVLLSFVNIIFVYSYVLKQNRPQYICMKLYGASNKILILLAISEIIVYTVPAFFIGWIISKILINSTYLKYSISYIGIAEVILLLTIIIVVVSIVSIVQLLHVLKYNRNEEDGDFWLANIAAKLKLKNTYLAIKNYTGTFFSELIIIIQVAFVAFVLTYSVSYLFERGQDTRYIQEIFSESNGVAVAYFKADKYISENGSPYFNDTIQEWMESTDRLEGIVDIGYKTTLQNVVIPKDDGEESYGIIVNLSEGLINNIQLPLYKGRWFNETEAMGIDRTNSTIPIIISYYQHKTLNLDVGDKFEGIHLTMEEAYSNAVYNVIGILKRDSKVISLESSPPTLKSIIRNMNYDNDLDTLLFYAPIVLHEGKTLDDATTRYSNMLLFADSAERIEEWRDINNSYSDIFLVEELAKQSDQDFKTGSMAYEIHAYVSCSLLLVGIAGYNMLSWERNKRVMGVYYSCGMNGNKPITISLLSNAILFVFGGLIGSLWGVVRRTNDLQMNTVTMIYSISTTVAVIVLFYIVSLWFVLIKTKKAQISSLVKK